MIYSNVISQHQLHNSNPNGFAVVSNTSSLANNSNVNNIVTYTQLAHSPHIEELNFRLQAMNGRSEIEYAEVIASSMPTTFGSDINPSVGDLSDRESEFNIRQLDSTVSSLSGVNCSTGGSPIAERQRQRETDF